MATHTLMKLGMAQQLAEIIEKTRTQKLNEDQYAGIQATLIELDKCERHVIVLRELDPDALDLADRAILVAAMLSGEVL